MHRFAVLNMLVAWFVITGPVAAAELPDPMRPPQLDVGRTAEPVSEASSWELHMVRISPDHRVAVINGRIVKPGDRVSGAQVVSVGSNTVQLRKDGKRFSVSLSRTAVKRPSAYGGVMMSEAMQGDDP